MFVAGGDADFAWLMPRDVGCYIDQYHQEQQAIQKAWFITTVGHLRTGNAADNIYG